MAIQRLSHIGICVTDLARSTAFYRDVFGFAPRSRLSTDGEPTATLIDLSPVALDAVYLERDGTRIELLHFPEPGVTGEPGPHPVNRLGLTHLSFRVEDLDETVAQVLALGGQVLEKSRIWNAEYQSGAVFVTDPDGLRIELLQSPGGPDTLPGQA